jgi:hypothetical protein
MYPNEALRLQIARYQQMTGEERLGIGLRLHDIGFVLELPSSITGSRVCGFLFSATRGRRIRLPVPISIQRHWWIATPEDVILYKLFWNRLNPSDRQLADASGIVAIQPIPLLDVAF